jgi:hypothetical protein
MEGRIRARLSLGARSGILPLRYAREIPELDSAGLRKFGLTTGAILAGLFGVVLPWFLGRSFPLWPWGIAGVLAFWALLAPSTMRRVYRGWMRFGLIMSRLMTPLLMGLLFFLVVTPMGLVRRALGVDSLARRRDADARTYRVPSKPVTSLERPF